MKEDKREKQKQNILESAARVFSEKGFMKTKISDIASKASIGKGTIYGYFKSKDDLFFEVFRWYNDQIMEKISENSLPDDASAPEKIISLTKTLMECVVEMAEFYSLSLEFWSAVAASEKRDEFKNEFQVMYSDFILMLKSILDQGVDCGDFSGKTDTENTARGIISIFDALGLQYWLGQKFDPVYSAVNMIETILKGIKSEGE